MEEMDFNITNIRYVIHRKSNPLWTMENVDYKTEYTIVIAMEGKVFYTIDGEKISGNKNSVFVFPPGTVRSARTDPESPWEFITVNFTMDLNDECKNFFNKTIITNGEVYKSKFQDIAHWWMARNPLYKVECKNAVSEILCGILLETMREGEFLHTKKLETAKSYIQSNFRGKITVEELAERAGLSESYFRKIFKQAYGDAPMNYITKLRISAACDLLISGEANVTQAARWSGFDDIYYFSTLFKRHMGMSPTQFVKKHTGR